MQMKIALAQMEVLPGRPRVNLARMLDYLDKAKKGKADLVIFPELAIPGYLLGDLWEYEWFLRECEECGHELIGASEGIAVIFGNIAVDWAKHNEDGRARKYNACFVAQDKKMARSALPYPFYIKTALPNYRQFDDARHFYGSIGLALESARPPSDFIRPFKITVRGREISLACMICEDGWISFYPVKPPLILAEARPDMFINISSSPFALGKTGLRHRLFSDLARNSGIPLLYVNHTGIQNNGKNIYTYDGASRAFSPSGDATVQCPSFVDGLFFCRYDKGRFLPEENTALRRPPETGWEIYAAVAYGTKKFLAQCQIEKIAIGLSGGIDSSVAAALYAHILGSRRVLLLNMPSRYNSALTIDLARQLAKNLGAPCASVPIGESVELTARQIGAIRVNGRPLVLSDFALENVQARDRSSRILAAAAAALGGGFSCNANKSELTAGYGTFYGDLAGMLAPLGDLWKHQVYALGRYLNAQVFKAKTIPETIFHIAPSAELSPAQTVGTGGDPLHYPYHDYLFSAFVEKNLSPLEIALWYKDGSLEEKIGCEKGLTVRLFPTRDDFFADLERWWLALGGLSIAKRIQAPPIVTVSERAFGFERRETQIPAALPAKYLLLKQQLLSLRH
ncbi:MAG: NAD(+) synthase [Acidaminococcales bacterium]|nr:NAD(+) synthase [Acidaminococcales bacterium]